MSIPPLRVCVIITGLGMGGAEHALLQLLSRFDRTRFDLRLLVLGNEDALAQRFEQIDVPPRWLDLHAGRWPVGGVRRLLQAVREFQPDVLQGWMYHGNLAASFAAARVSEKVPVCWSVRDTPDAAHGHSRFTRAVIRLSSWYAGRVATIFNVSLRSADYCAEHYDWPRARTQVLPNGIDTARFQPEQEARRRLRSELGIADAAPVIGMVARWTPVKNHALFLEAAAAFRAAHPEARFVLVGKGLDADNGELAALVDRHRLYDNLHLLGMRHDVEAIYPAFDVATLTSRSEGFPNVLAEAMSCGVPAVSTDVGDARDIVGPSGEIVASTPDALAAAWARQLVASRELPRQRILERYDLEAIATRLQQHYLALLGRA